MMETLIKYTPQIFDPIFAPMVNWGFWEWLQAIVTLVAAFALTRAALIGFRRYLFEKFGTVILKSLVRFNTKAAGLMVETLLHDMTHFHRFQIQPELITALCFKYTIKGALLAIIGIFCWWFLISPFDYIIGLCMIGLGCVELLFVYRQMSVFLSIEQHAKKMLNKIEANLQSTEALIPDDAILHENFAKLRWAAWHMARTAEHRATEIDLAIIKKISADNPKVPIVEYSAGLVEPNDTSASATHED